MTAAQNLSAETVARMADEWIGAAMSREQLEAVTGLLSALMAEMVPMRAMDVASVEPATTYEAREP